MTTMVLCAVEPFTSPVWGSNFTVFTSATGDVIPESQSKEYISKCCKYAKLHEVYLVPERFILMEYQCMCLISPSGKVLGAQKCLYWNTEYRGVKRSSAMEVLNTEFGAIALCVDVDIFRPEVPRIAVGMGAHVLICSQQISMADYNSGMIVSGVWSAAQNNNLFTVGVSNAFNCVCAPRVMTKHNDGFLVAPGLKVPMNIKLAADAIDRMPPRYCLSRKFYAVHRKELIGE
ncbi:hypothetical protein LJC63_10385 [Ruminococcaceae bacterium OttesenSCG-928-L11]|nr:hypothetical protein [Ruminococcaceae bacterium OttesenSCG-928-L11]